MEIAPKPKNETQRLASIEALNLPSDYDKEALDRITHLASLICNTPIALVTLLTETEQLFLSKKGLPEEKTSREIAFCSHTILNSQEIMVVPDTFKDSRFIDNPLVVKDPHIRFYAGAPIVTPDGFPIGSLCVIDNKPNQLTLDQVTALETLALHVNHLIALQAKNRQMSRVNAQLEDTCKGLETFSFAAAHDLREPIKAIEKAIRFLLNYSKNKFTKDEKELLELSAGSAEKLNTLVEDLLNYSKHHNIDVENFEEVDVSNIIENIKLAYALTLSDKAASIVVGHMPKIKGHKNGLQIVFHNLIGNALKYSKKTSPPEIHINCADVGGYWKFTLKDNGIGFSNDFAKEIFKPFVRLHSSDAYRGSGIGLSLTQKIILQHKGQIEATGEEGVGTQFTFTIPK